MQNICEWRDSAVYPEYYSVSSDGRVFSKRNGKILKPKMSKAGYLRVGLACNGKVKMMSIHRLVAIAFIDNPKNKPTVNHKNENKTDNRVENLEWATNAEQNVYGTRIERAVSHTDYKGRNIDYKDIAKKHDYSKENMCNRMPVTVWRVQNGERILYGAYSTQREAAKNTGVCTAKVSECVNGKKRSCKGFIFEESEVGDGKTDFSL